MDEEEKYYTSLGMRTYGGGFVQALGMALMHADQHNANKIKATFSEYCEKYYIIGKNEHENTQKKFKK